MDNLLIIISFVGSLGLFIYGMGVMSKTLEKIAGPKMKQILAKLTKSKFHALIFGIFATIALQTSSASTVIVVSFVNAGLMTLKQSVGVFMGANIGTTATAWLFTGSATARFLRPTTLAPLAVAIGVAMTFTSKKENIKQIGELILGFGILFMGMSGMSDAVIPLRDSPAMAQAFIIAGNSPLIGILMGVFVTIMVQSSTASIAILLAVVQLGVVPFDAAIFIILGQNIGTCVTALLSSIGANKNAKAAAYVHLLFNLIGSFVIGIIMAVYFAFINPEISGQVITMLQISIAHTTFNILNTAMLYPFSDWLVKIATKMSESKILTSKNAVVSEAELVHLDERVLAMPTFAIESLTKEIIRFAKITLKNLNLSTEALIEKDDKKIRKVISKEKEINQITESITAYMVQLCNQDISETQNNVITALFHTVNDIERVGDHAENLAELAKELIKENVYFTEKALNEIREVISLTEKCFKGSIEALEKNDKEIIEDISKCEEKIDELEKELRANHIKRLTKKECDQLSGIVFLDAITNLERVSDHSLNIAEAVLKF
jgi:phosphate:Na+ symporter